MATQLTHLAIVNELKNCKKQLFDWLAMDYVYSGALFPDYCFFYWLCLNKHCGFEGRIKNEKGIAFGETLFKVSKNREELSFAVGVISHCVLDKHFHKYLKENNIKKESHLAMELFYDCRYLNLDVPKLRYPKRFIERTLAECYGYKQEKFGITKFGLNIYTLFLREIKNQILKKKYAGKGETSYIDLLALLSKFKKMNMKKLLNPKLNNKEKHLKNLEICYGRAVKECNKILRAHSMATSISKATTGIA